MDRKIIVTGDGSHTIFLPEWNEHYHSKHGAIQEANHVFIQSGLHHICKLNPKKELSILEVGLGTGLNAYLTLLEIIKLRLRANYIGIDAYPVSLDEVKKLNYPKAIFDKEQDDLFDVLHSSQWESNHQITDRFALTKRQQFFNNITEFDSIDLIYFDAFGPRVQPELWTEDIFKIMFKALKKNGVLVTYSAKGSVRRAMQDVGFTVERLPGPPGKREMLRATKLLMNSAK